MVAIGVSDDGYRKVMGAAEAKVLEVASELEGSKLKEAARVVRGGYAETLTYKRFPRERWRRTHTNNAVERLNREVRRRTWVVAPSPTGGAPSFWWPRG